MSNTVSRVTVNTTLRIGSITAPVALYKAIADPAKDRKWELADFEGAPWSPPSAAPVAPAEPGDPLGAPPAAAAATSAPIGGAVPPAGEPEPETIPDPRFSKDEQVWLIEDNQQYVVMSASHFEATDDGPAEWRYALSVDGTAAKALEGNPFPERALSATLPKPRKGIRKADGVFVDLTDEIEEIAERTTLEQMQVVSFIDVAHVPRERIIGAYYLAPGTGGTPTDKPPTKLLAVLSHAMRDARRVAVVRFSKRKGQTLGVLTVRRDGAVLLLELAYAAQWRDPNPKSLAPAAITVPNADAEAAAELIEAMAAKRDSLDGIRNPRLVAEGELVTRAEAGELDEYELTPDLDVAAETEQLGLVLDKALQAIR